MATDGFFSSGGGGAAAGTADTRQRQAARPAHGPVRQARMGHPACKVRDRRREMERLPRDDERHGDEDQHHAQHDARRELLAEDRDAEDQRRDGLQRPEDRRIAPAIATREMTVGKSASDRALIHSRGSGTGCSSVQPRSRTT